MSTTAHIPQAGQFYNAAVRAVVSTFGVLVGIGSIDHGLLEILQGNHRTPGPVIYALGPGYSWTAWKQGGEGAFTLVPNFLLTGILATLIGMFLIAWSIRYIHTVSGPSIFLLFSIASFLTGGGAAQLLLFTLNWAMATQVRASMEFWSRTIPPLLRPRLGRLWRWTLVSATVLFVVALEIAVFGYVPGVSAQRQLLFVCWTLLLLALALYLLSFFSAVADDLETRRTRLAAGIS